MHGVVSLLDMEHSRQVEALWAELAAAVSIRGALRVPYPHVSHHVAESYDLELLESVVRDAARETAPFHIRTAGVGIFTSLRPVVYLPVVRDPALTAFQAPFWHRLATVASGINRHYHPDRWMPHITIGERDVDREAAGAIVRLLAERDLAWEIPIDNLTLLYDPGATHEVRFRYLLGGG